jgi:hypothetical protein
LFRGHRSQSRAADAVFQCPACYSEQKDPVTAPRVDLLQVTRGAGRFRLGASMNFRVISCEGFHPDLAGLTSFRPLILPNRQDELHEKW